MGVDLSTCGNHVKQHRRLGAEGGDDGKLALEVADQRLEKFPALEPRVTFKNKIAVEHGSPRMRLFEPWVGIGVALGPDLGLRVAAEEAALIGKRHLF